jgi:hypothetical protein
VNPDNWPFWLLCIVIGFAFAYVVTPSKRR